MKQSVTLILALCAGWMICWAACGRKPETFDARIRTMLLVQTDTLQRRTDSLLAMAERGESETALQAAFLDCRRAYKQLEWFSEYYAPGTSRLLNGPPLPEVETEETKMSDPAGLQVVEEALYPLERESLAPAVRSFAASIIALRRTANNTLFDTAHVFDAARMAMFRLAALGLSGFDTPLSRQGIAEARETLLSVKFLMGMIGAPDTLLRRFETVTATATGSPDAFDFAGYYATQLHPLSRAMTNWYNVSGHTQVKELLAIDPLAGSLFDSGAIRAAFFVHQPDAIPTPEKIALGKLLFHDPKLAGTGNRSCASCHNPEKAFTDGLARNVSLHGGMPIARNTPTVMYAGLQQGQFYDMRSPTLENQVMDVLQNPHEMRSSAANVAQWISRDPVMRRMFVQAFPEMGDSVRPRFVMAAIAAYIRSLQPFSSPFDAFMRGDGEIGEEERRGFNVFMGKAKCATCHFLPLFNGTAAPAFTSTESEVLGVLTSPNIRRLDGDSGRYVHVPLEPLLFAFKTPTLRNIAKTAPYMHNGAYRTLAEVVDFYDTGGAAGIGISLPNQTLPPDSLRLTPLEKQDLVRFLESLTDR
ncbi:cytochrome-c peroxidase [Chitinophaga caseinilytica]|uniref:Cytochrome c peroxidase n=1 Tax=Chitinophaga caseinilytica TaxID=2267521 RepID=A0ABZ2Z1G0_9BACT